MTLVEHILAALLASGPQTFSGLLAAVVSYFSGREVEQALNNLIDSGVVEQSPRGFLPVKYKLTAAGDNLAKLIATGTLRVKFVTEPQVVKAGPAIKESSMKVPADVPCVAIIDVVFLNPERPGLRVELYGPEPPRNGRESERWWYATADLRLVIPVDAFPSRTIVESTLWWRVAQLGAFTWTVQPVEQKPTSDELPVTGRQGRHNATLPTQPVEQKPTGDELPETPRWLEAHLQHKPEDCFHCRGLVVAVQRANGEEVPSECPTLPLIVDGDKEGNKWLVLQLLGQRETVPLQPDQVDAAHATAQVVRNVLDGRQLLARAIADAALRAGIYNGAPITVLGLVQLCDDMSRVILDHNATVTEYTVLSTAREAATAFELLRCDGEAAVLRAALASDNTSSVRQELAALGEDALARLPDAIRARLRTYRHQGTEGA